MTMRRHPSLRLALVGLAVTAAGLSARAGELRHLSMDEAVRLSLARNPTYEIAREEIRRAQALLEQARSQSIPTLSGAAAYNRLDNDRVSAGVIVDPKSQAALTATLTIPLVSPRTWAAWSHAKDNIDVTRTSANDTRRVIAVATGHAYLAVFAQKRVLEATLRARDTAKAHYDFAHTRFAGGVGNRLDEVRAAQELATDEALVHASRSAISRAQEALGVLVGDDEPVDSAEEPVLPEAPPLPAAIDLAAKTRTDVIEANTRAQAAQHASRDNWTEYSPYVVGTFQPFYENPPTEPLPKAGWQAQLLLTVPFYAGGLQQGLGRERAALSREAELGVEGTVRQARSDVRAAFDTLQQANASLVQIREAARLANEALHLATLAYNAGATTDIEVIDAERQARDAETQEEVAADNARQAQLDMLAASGRFP
jgi:outer membrane protein TolC